MYKTEGYWNVTPRIKRLSFPRRGKFLMGGGVTWDSCPEVIHIEQILGNFQNYAHEPAEVESRQ